MNLAVLASGAGSTLEALLEAQSRSQLKPKICLLITDNPHAGALSVAAKYGLPSCSLPLKESPNYETWDGEILKALEGAGTESIFLLGFLKKIGPRVLNKFQGKIMNTHPSLIPKFSGKGMYGRRVHEAVIAAKEKETGVTLHVVDEDYDRGPILRQVIVPVLAEDTAASLEARVKLAEKKLILDFLNQMESS